MTFRTNVITRWQQICVCFLCMLSTIIRLLPRQAALTSGPYSWIAALLSFIPLFLIYALSNRAFRNAGEEDGFAQLFIKSLGTKLGKAAVIIFTLWLIFYVSILLKNAADKYISSSYQGALPAFFIVIILALSMISLLGSFASLSKTAEAFFPLLALVMVLVFAMGIHDINSHNLPPLPPAHIPQMLSGVSTLAASQSVALYLGFMEGRVVHKEKRNAANLIFLIMMCATVCLLCLTTIGIFGSTLTGSLSFPFFVLVRNMSLFNVLDRVESAIIGLWVISDFILISTFMFIVVSNIRICAGLDQKSHEKAGALSMKDGRWIIWIVAAAVLTLSLCFFSNSFELAYFLNVTAPIVNSSLIFVLLPIILIIGIARKKL